MNPTHKIVSRLPVEEIWAGQRLVSTIKVRDLGASDIVDLLRSGIVRFVVADVGLPFRWYDERQCFEVWKSEVKQHIADGGHASLDDFKSGFFYFASEWADGGMPIVLLSKNH